MSCIPENVVLNQQRYRHIDYVQFSNSVEIDKFYLNWEKSGHSEQRVGYLYGYFIEDPKHKTAIRVIVEAIHTLSS